MGNVVFQLFLNKRHMETKKQKIKINKTVFNLGTRLIFIMYVASDFVKGDKARSNSRNITEEIVLLPKVLIKTNENA